MAEGASEVAEVSGEVLAAGGEVGEEDLVAGEVEGETPTSGRETGRARTRGKDFFKLSNFFPSCLFYFRFL